MTPRSGTPYNLVSGGSTAAVSGSGAALRGLVIDAEVVLDGFALDEIAPGGAGQVLAPWPNRLADGTYRFDGIDARVALNEPEKRNAIHGLVRWQEWAPVEIASDQVTLETVIVPSPAYPWRLRVAITYRLEPDRCTVAFAATNEDDRPAPFGIGFHPYFLAGEGGVDAATISVGAAVHLRLDERALPVGSEPVADTPFASISTTEGLALSGVVLDDCFTAIAEAPAGAPAATFRPGPGRRPLEIALGGAFTHLMCFTGDTLGPPRRRRAVAIEPMTCPPNALVSGDGIAIIDPGARFADEFSISLG